MTEDTFLAAIEKPVPKGHRISKIDLGVHKHMEIEQEEYCFDIRRRWGFQMNSLIHVGVRLERVSVT